MPKSRRIFFLLSGGGFLSLITILWIVDIWLYRSFQQVIDQELAAFRTDDPHPATLSGTAGHYQTEQKTGWPWGASRILHAAQWQYSTPSQHGDMTASQLVIGGNWLQWAWNWFLGRGTGIYSPYSLKASFTYKGQILNLSSFKTQFYIRSYVLPYQHYQLIMHSTLLSGETPNIEGKIVLDDVNGKGTILSGLSGQTQNDQKQEKASGGNGSDHNEHIMTIDLHSKTARFYLNEKIRQAGFPFIPDNLSLSDFRLCIILNSDNILHLAPLAVSLPLYAEKDKTFPMPRLTFTGRYDIGSRNGFLVASLSHWRAGLSTLLESPTLRAHLPAPADNPSIQGLGQLLPASPSGVFQKEEQPLTLEIPVMNAVIQTPSITQWQDILNTLRTSLQRQGNL